MNTIKYIVIHLQPKFKMLAPIKNMSMVGSIKDFLVYWFLEFKNTIKW